MSGLLVTPGVSCLLALPCLALMSLKTVILSLRPRLRVPVSSSCVHRDTSVLALLYYEHSSGVSSQNLNQNLVLS